MRNQIKSFVIVVAVSILLILSPGYAAKHVPSALAASGATFVAPPNNNFEAGPLQVGSGPTNYDFASGGGNWTTVFGSVGYSAGVATLSPSTEIRSDAYALTSLMSIRIRYKAGAIATVSVVNSGGTAYGIGDLSCINCTTGSWVDKYIDVDPSLTNGKIQIFNTDTGTTNTVVDEVGTQWVPFPEWTRTPAFGANSQLKQDSTNYLELKGTFQSNNFTLTENRLEFDYAFPVSSGNSLTATLHRASDSSTISSESLSGGGVSWTRVVWAFSSSDVGQPVYLTLYSPSNPSWVDNVADNFSETASRSNQPSAKAGEPFDTTTGEFSHSHADLSIPGRGIPLEFARTYHSMEDDPTNLGYNWRNTYSIYLRIDGDGSVTVYYPTGGAAYFHYSGGAFTPPSGVHDTLVHNGDGTYTLTTTGILHDNFSSGGRLSSIADRNGNAITVLYDGSGFLSQASEPGGRALTFTTDTGGRIIQIDDTAGRIVQFDYDSNGDLHHVTDAKGGVTTYEYSNHRMTSLTDSSGHVQNENIYDGASRVVEQTDAIGGKTCVYYGTSPSYTSASCPGAASAPSPGQTVVVDPRGNSTTYDFDTSFRTAAITDALSGVTSYAYDSNSNRTCVTDPNGHQTGFTFDSSGNTTAIIDANNTNSSTCALQSSGVEWVYSYTSFNNLSQSIDPLGNVASYFYDSVGNLKYIVRDKFQVTSIDADGDGWTDSTESYLGTDSANACAATSALNDEGLPDRWPLDMNDDTLAGPQDVLAFSAWYGQSVPPAPVRLDLFQSASINAQDVLKYSGYYGLRCPVPLQLTCFEYDSGSHGFPKALVEATTLLRPWNDTDSCTGTRTSFQYDSSGDLTKVTKPDRQTAGSSAETGSQCGTLGTGNGVNNDSSDDSVIDDGCPNTILNYDSIGRPTSEVDALGRTTSFTFDNFDMPLTQTDNLGDVTTRTYDSKGNLKTVTDGNRAVAGSAAESGSACGTPGTGNGVNNDSSDDSVIDDGCPNTIYNYDNADRLTSVVDALGHVTVYGYDSNANLTSVTDANRQTAGSSPETGSQCGTAGTGNGANNDSSDDSVIDDGCPSTIYTYDSLNHLHTTTDALARVTTYTYDAASNLTQMVDPRGIKTVYTPDALNRQHIIQYYSSGMTLLATTTYDYDAAGNRHDMVDGTGTTTYSYDVENRLTSAAYPGSKTVSYSYDVLGNLSKVTYPGTTGVVNYGYDVDHRMTSVQQSWGSIGPTTYTYDVAGNLTKTLLPNGAWTDYGYDNAERLTSTVNKQPGPTTMSTYTYTLDKVGNRTGMTGTGGPQTYTLDPLNRLTQATYPGPATDNYGYDADGNRTSKNSTTYANDAAGELTSVGSTNYTYDQNGNLSTRGASDSFTFNYANQLTQTVIGGTTSTSTYSGDGLRMSHTVGAGSPANYVWDVNRSVPEILQDGTNTYVYGLGRISSTDGSGNQTYYDTDGLGSTADLTNSSATKTDGYSYDAFGTPTHSPGSSANPFQFTGQQTDADSGLQYLRARYYDPTTGRFLGKDPLSGTLNQPATQNRYAYAINNPTSFNDPTGRSVFDLLVSLQPVLDCGLTDFSCIGDYLGSVDEYNNFVFDVLTQCAIWGVGGAISAGLVGAAVGCAAGGGLAVLDKVYRNPVSACAAWGAAGYKTGGWAGAAILCATAVAAYYAPDSEEGQCAAWLLGGFANHKVTGGGPVRGGLGNCLSAVLSSHDARVANGEATANSHPKE